MPAALVGAVLAALLVTSGGPVTAGQAPTVTMTTVNWGAPVSLLDPTQHAWAHPAGSGAAADVEVTVALNGLSVSHWIMELTAPDSFQEPTTQRCEGREWISPHELTCHFAVAASSGINPVRLVVSADGNTIATSDSGILWGGSLDWDAGYEVLDATGAWVAVPHHQAITLLATSQSALRFVVLNTGTIPLRLTNGCDSRTVIEGAEVMCRLRGVRTAQSLAGEYTTHLRLEDAVGGGASFDIRTGIRTFAGGFSLTASRVALGQVIAVSGSGLPTDDAFAMQFRVDDQPLVLGTSTTRSGSTHLSFPLSNAALGAAHLNVVHEGLTIASLPFVVTKTADPPDAAPNPWPWLLLLLVPIAGLLLWHRRRRRHSS